jgi:D-methionine transport system ATP-binding protein
VLITHQMEVVRRVCDRVAVLKDGRVVEEGATADVFLHPQHAATRAMLAEGEEAFETADVPPGGRLAKLTFRGGSTYEPELSRVARSVGVDYSILSGRISRIRGEPYGQLVVAFTGGDAEAAVAQLTARGVMVEAV